MINRDKLINVYEGRITALKEQIKIIKDIPLDKPILFQLKVYNGDIQIVASVKYMNPESFRVNIIAIESEGFYNKPFQSFKIKNILKWELFPVTNFPLLVNWPKKSKLWETTMRGN